MSDRELIFTVTLSSYTPSTTMRNELFDCAFVVVFSGRSIKPVSLEVDALRDRAPRMSAVVSFQVGLVNFCMP